MVRHSESHTTTMELQTKQTIYVLCRCQYTVDCDQPQQEEVEGQHEEFQVQISHNS